MGALRRRGFLDKADAKAIAEAIDDQLGDGFKLRNVLAHGEAFLVTRRRTAVRAVERSPDDLLLTLEDGTEITVLMFVKRLSEEVGSKMRERGIIYRAVYATVVLLIAGETPSLASE